MDYDGRVWSIDLNGNPPPKKLLAPVEMKILKHFFAAIWCCANTTPSEQMPFMCWWMRSESDPVRYCVVCATTTKHPSGSSSNNIDSVYHATDWAIIWLASWPGLTNKLTKRQQTAEAKQRQAKGGKTKIHLTSCTWLFLYVFFYFSPIFCFVLFVQHKSTTP